MAYGDGYLPLYEDGRLPLAERHRIARERNGFVTKADLITPESLADLDNVTIDETECVGCGIALKSEGDFARHFIVDDVRYVNLGHCPRGATI